MSAPEPVAVTGVRPGQVWRDNDPRSENRCRTVATVTETHVVWERHSAPVSLRALHTDGKPRKSGWSCIQDAP